MSEHRHSWKAAHRVDDLARGVYHYGCACGMKLRADFVGAFEWRTAEDYDEHMDQPQIRGLASFAAEADRNQLSRDAVDTKEELDG